MDDKKKAGLRGVSMMEGKAEPWMTLDFGGGRHVSLLWSAEHNSFAWTETQGAAGVPEVLDSGMSASACAVVKRFLPAEPWADDVKCLCRTAVRTAVELERRYYGLYVYGFLD